MEAFRRHRYDTADERAQEVTRNGCRFLYKPFRPEELADLLRVLQEAEPTSSSKRKRS